MTACKISKGEVEIRDCLLQFLYLILRQQMQEKQMQESNVCCLRSLSWNLTLSVAPPVPDYHFNLFILLQDTVILTEAWSYGFRIIIFNVFLSVNGSYCGFYYFSSIYSSSSEVSFLFGSSWPQAYQFELLWPAKCLQNGLMSFQSKHLSDSSWFFSLCFLTTRKLVISQTWAIPEAPLTVPDNEGKPGRIKFVLL